MVTDAQVKLLRKKLMKEGMTQEAAAAAAAMSVRSARSWQSGPLPSEKRSPRTWRTREDPFCDVWDTFVVPLLVADTERKLQAKSVFDALDRDHPGRFEPSQVRTLQRHIRAWRALHGPEQDVVFPQEHVVGREAAFDFTDCRELEVTVGGAQFDHLLFVVRLSASKWTYAEVAVGETWEALSQGLQNALWELGCRPEVVRHDNLSAATRELKEGTGRSLTVRFQALLDHYGLRSTRISPGESHENGVVEKANDLLKTALDQALRLRESREFNSREAYAAFVAEVRGRMNAQRRQDIEAEKLALRPLPATRLLDHTEYDVVVRAWSTIRVRNQTYSVPSRLKGHSVTVKVFAERLEIWFQGVRTAEIERARGRGAVTIDYRHVIWSLVRKPGAFARYRFREELFPTLVFRRAYDALVGWRGERADVEYVRILHLAASTLQGPVERALLELLAEGRAFDYAAVRSVAHPEPIGVPEVNIGTPDLAHYDRLLGGAQ